MKGEEMIDVLGRGLALLMIAALTLASGCSGNGAEGPTDPEAGGNDPAVTMGADDPVAIDGQDEGDFSAIQEERSAAEEQRAALIASFLQAARSQMSLSRFDEAEKLVLRALDVEQSNPQALELLRNLRALAGDTEFTQAQEVEYIRSKRRLVRQQQMALVNDHYARAEQAVVDADWRAAKTELEQAKLIIDFDPYRTDFGARAGEVATMLNEVEAQLVAQRQREADDQDRLAFERVQEQEAREAARRAEQVKELLTRAVESFNNAEFDQSTLLAEKVLRLDGSQAKAREILRDAEQARHAEWKRAFYERRREEYQRWLEQVRATQVPITDLLNWTDVDRWEEITKLRASSGDAVSREQEDSDAVAAIKAKLDNEIVTFNFDAEETFGDVIRTIRSQMGFNIIVDNEVMLELGEEPVSLVLIEQNLGSALRTLLANMGEEGLAYTFRSDVMYITTKEKALGTPLPRVYEVRDLTISLPNFTGPDLTVRPGPAGEEAQKAVFGEEGEPTVSTSIEALADLIRANIEPTTWDTEGFVLEPASGRLVVVTTPEIHKQVENFLNDLRKFTKLTVHVESRFISLQRGFLQDIGVDFRGSGGQNPGQVALLDDVTYGRVFNPNTGVAGATGGAFINSGSELAGLGRDNNGPGLPAAASLSPSAGAFYQRGTNDFRGRTENVFDRSLGQLLSGNGGATVAFSILDDAQINAIFRGVEKDLDTSVITAPRLTIFNNQRANLTLVNQVSYVKDYDVEVAQTAFIADPLVDIIQDGLTLDVKPTVSHDRKYVTLEVKPTVATLLRPIRTFESSLSGISTPVVIELPEIRYSRAETTVRVPDHGYVVIGGLKHIRSVDRRSETPVLSNIPLLGFLFTRKGRSDEIRDLIIVMHVKILDLTELEENLVR